MASIVFTPSSKTSSAGSACSTSVRMTRPFCSNGVGISAGRCGSRGRRATNAREHSFSCGRGRRAGARRWPRRRRPAGTAGRRSPPRCWRRSRPVPSRPPRAAVPESLVRSTSAPAARRSASTWLLVSTGTAMLVGLAHGDEQARAPRGPRRRTAHGPGVVDEVSCSPSGSSIAPRLAPEDLTSSTRRRRVHVPVEADDTEVETFGLIPDVAQLGQGRSA